MVIYSSLTLQCHVQQLALYSSFLQHVSLLRPVRPLFNRPSCLHLTVEASCALFAVFHSIPSNNLMQITNMPCVSSLEINFALKGASVSDIFSISKPLFIRPDPTTG